MTASMTSFWSIAASMARRIAGLFVGATVWLGRR